MRSLALAALAALAVAVDCACPRGFEPLNKTMRRLAMSGPMTWHEVDDACSEQFPGGFQMLHRDFLRLSDEDRALCQGHSVPLRLEKRGLEPVVWSDKPLDNWEEVNSTYLERQVTDADSTRTSECVGSLSPSTGEWRLVDNDTVFECAVCQRAWVEGFWRIKEERPEPFDAAYTFRLVATDGDRVDVDEAIRRAEERINGTVDRDEEVRHVKIVKVTSDPDDGNGTWVRLQSSRPLEPDDVIPALNGSFEVGSWQATHLCPSSSLHDLDWQETSAGDLDLLRLPGSQYAIRRCLWRTGPDGVRQPVWDDDVLLWTDRLHECVANSVSNLLRRLQEFVEHADPGHLELKPLVEITDAANVQDLAEDNLVEVTDAIVGALSSLVATTTSASSACHGTACAFLAGDLQGAEGIDTLLISHKGATPTFLNVDDTDAANQTTHMSLHLSRALASAGRVAVHSWRSLTVYSGDKKIDDTMVVQVVSSRPFDESEPERNRPVVTFQLNNTEIGPVGRYRSVWSLAESPADLRSCPLVRSRGPVDTYLCNKWVPKSNNVTTLSFVAFKLNADKNFTNFFVYRVLPQVLLGFTAIPIDKYAILEVAKFTNTFVEAIVQKDSVELTTPSVEILNPWEEILSGVFLTVEEPVLTASLDHVKVLVSDLTVSDPVVGFSLDRLAGAGAVQTVTVAGSRNVSTESEVDLVLGAGVQEHCEQLAVVAVSDVKDFHINGSLEAHIKKLMVVYLVATSKSETEAGSGNVYFEIHLRGASNGDDKSNLVDSINEKENVTHADDHDASQSSGVEVATWSETARDWLVSSCSKLRSTRSKSVVRCESLTLVDRQFRGSYLIFEPVG